MSEEVSGLIYRVITHPGCSLRGGGQSGLGGWGGQEVVRRMGTCACVQAELTVSAPGDRDKQRKGKAACQVGWDRREQGSRCH